MACTMDRRLPPVKHQCRSEGVNSGYQRYATESSGDYGVPTVR
jgi:hypothetical protein